ncbi:MAG: hypothetical protein PF690_14775, partial [Deltaproteobacteria bacterium]|nr:hypothetical protein [Deltaproteobacteria bacterium]
IGISTTDRTSCSNWSNYRCESYAWIFLVILQEELTAHPLNFILFNNILNSLRSQKKRIVLGFKLDCSFAVKHAI